MSRLELEGALARLRREKLELAIRAKNHMRTIKEKLTFSDVHEATKLDVPGVVVAAHDLRDAWNRLMEIEGQIEAINRELV